MIYDYYLLFLPLQIHQDYKTVNTIYIPSLLRCGHIAIHRVDYRGSDMVSVC